MSPCPENARRSVDEQPCLPLRMDHACVAWQGAAVEDPRALAMALDALEVEGTFVVLADDVLASIAIWRQRWAWHIGGGSAVVPLAERSARNSCAALQGATISARQSVPSAFRPGLRRDGWSVWGWQRRNRISPCALCFTPCAPHTMTGEGRERLGLLATGELELLALGLVAEADLLA